MDTWWELREPRPGAISDEKKIISPSIAYYNNFTFLDDEGYPVNTTYYGVPNDESDYHFLLGIANSILMQFYMRMEGTPYRGSYLMYYGTDWGSLPLTRDSEIEADISQKTKEIMDFIESLESADKVLADPAHIYDDFDTDTLPLKEHPAIESFDLGDVEVDEPVLQDNTITFQNLTAEITFFEGNDEYQELLLELLEMKTFGLAEELKDIHLPTDVTELPTIIDSLKTIRDDIDTASEEMGQLQAELDELILDLYEFDDEERKLIKERTPTPSNPLDTRVVKN